MPEAGRYGLAITPGQRAEMHVSSLRFEINKAILRVHSDFPDLTREEILQALLITAERQVQYLRQPDPEPKED